MVGLATLGIGTDAHAAFKEGLAAYRAKDYVGALREWKPMAEAGNVQAQMNIAVIYHYGLGADKNPLEAAKWYKKPAEQGNVVAQVNLASLLAHGKGVTRDYTEAANLLKKAAEAGNVQGQLDYANLFAIGKGVIKDPVEAQRWYKKAADQGNVTAQVRLGQLLLESGAGGAAEGIALLEKASKGGNVGATMKLAETYEKGTGVTADAKQSIE